MSLLRRFNPAPTFALHITYYIEGRVHQITVYVLEGEFWYISDDLLAENGIIRSVSEGDVFVPQQGWQFLGMGGCTTVR